MTSTDRRDLMFQDDIRDMVAEAYRGIDTGAGAAVADAFYTPDELAEVPSEAVRWALGVGDPVRRAGLTAGETVLDVGCGGGIDSVLAAQRVGPTGRVIGLDLLPEMCGRSEQAAQEAGVADRCEFLPGMMEAIPLPDASVDVVISNGVVNLSPRKSRALAEIARVLRPGGRVCLADLVVEGELPPDVLASEAAWAGCIAGAVSRRVLLRKLERAGFAQVDISEPTPLGVDDVARYPLFTDEALTLLRQQVPADAHDHVATAVVVRAVKPVGGPAPDRRQLLAAQTATGTRRLDDVPPTEVKAPGVAVRNLKRVEDIELKILDVEPGSATPFHTHVHAHEGVVMSGVGALRLEDRREPLPPGTAFSVAPGEPHAIECAGAEPFRIVCMDCFVE